MNTNKPEFKVARRLVKEIIARGFFVHVSDEEATSVKPTKDIEKVLPELCATGFDVVSVCEPSTVNPGKYARKATFTLIWGNAKDGSELIADYSANDLAESIYNNVYFDQYTAFVENME